MAQAIDSPKMRRPTPIRIESGSEEEKVNVASFCFALP
jgi:hypothetical protein